MYMAYDVRVEHTRKVATLRMHSPVNVITLAKSVKHIARLKG